MSPSELIKYQVSKYQVSKYVHTCKIFARYLVLFLRHTVHCQMYGSKRRNKLLP